MSSVSLLGVPREVAAISRAGLLYTAGLSRTATDVLSRPHSPQAYAARGGVSRAWPVIAVHGVLHNRSWSVGIARELKLAGFYTVSENYPTTRSWDAAVAGFVTHVRTVRHKLAADRVHIVTHSLGGLVARLALIRHPELVKELVSVTTIGTPHGGSPWARWFTRWPGGLGELGRDLTPTSRFLTHLADNSRPTPGVRWCSIYSPHDQVVPGLRGALTHPAYKATQVAIPHVGHIDLAFSPLVTSRVAEQLTQLDTRALAACTRNWIKQQLQPAAPQPLTAAQ